MYKDHCIKQLSRLIMMMMMSILSIIVAPETTYGKSDEHVKLAKIYESSEELSHAYPTLPKENSPLYVREETDSIELVNQETNVVLRRLSKEMFPLTPLTEAEQQQLNHPKEGGVYWKDFVNYILSNDRSLLIIKHYYAKILSVSERYAEVKDTAIYTLFGKLITELSPEVTMSLASPNQQYFVAYNWEEWGGVAFMYFYTSTGKLLSRQEIINSAHVRYSQNGEFVIVCSDMEHLFTLFTKTGDILYQNDYTQLIPHPHAYLSSVFISEHGTQMLLVVGRNLHLYDIEGRLLWTNGDYKGYVDECWFFSAQDILAVKLVNNRSDEDRYNIHLYSLHTGEVVDEILNVAFIVGYKNHIIVKKEKRYYDYQL